MSDSLTTTQFGENKGEKHSLSEKEIHTNTFSVEHGEADTPETEGEKQKEEKQWNALSYWLIAIIAILSLVYLWLSYEMRMNNLQLLHEIKSKVTVANAYGKNTQIYDDQIAQKEKAMSHPTYLVSIWRFSPMQQELEQLNEQVEETYNALLQKEKQDLQNSWKALNTKLISVQVINIESKDTIVAFVKNTEQQLKLGNLSVAQTHQLLEESKQMHTTLDNATEALLTKDLAVLGKKVQEHDDIAFPSKPEVQTFIQDTKFSKRNGQISTEELANAILLARQKIALVVQEVEETKKNALYATIQNYNAEAQTMRTFFAQRGGYDAQLQAIEQYTEKAASFTSDSYASTPADELTKQVEKELYPLLEDPRQKKLAVEEEERQAVIAQQKAAGIPEPPITQGKVILIDVGSQRLFAYENGQSIFDYPVPITTGKSGYDTVRGSFSIYTKATNFRMRSPFPDEWYDNMVSYWMPFYQGYGIHDAYWRTVYGTQDYPWVGSHGCVNTPYAEVERLYYWAEIGTPVIVR